MWSTLYKNAKIVTVWNRTLCLHIVQAWHVQTRPVTAVIVQKPRKPTNMTKKRKRQGMEGITPKLYNPVQTLLHDISLGRQLLPYFESIPWKNRPQYSQLWSAEQSPPLVDSKFGPVPKGSILSYQHPNLILPSGDITVDAGLPEPLPFEFPDLSDCCKPYIPLTSELSGKYNSLFVSLEQSCEFERNTRLQSATSEW